ncbi:glucose 1-dehydrogenase [bacterium]|nr:glucose 1-dehydrogenase [bacterium]
MNLKNQVAIVTGGKTGIGYATASRFAEEGARVIIADIQDANPEVLALKKIGADVHSIRLDVSVEWQVAQLVEQTVSAYGRIDVLVNNAGIDLAKKITETTEIEWDRLMNVNLKGVFLCSKAVIPVMRNQQSGVIVNVASELGIVGGSEIAAYSASKGGVIQLTKSMAIDHASDGIRINCIAPGPVTTPLLNSIIASATDPEKERNSIISKTLLKRFAHPEEIASVIVFVASDEASYMTGSVVTIDGGWTAQ